MTHFYSNFLLIDILKYEPLHDKTSKMTVRPAKTQTSLDIRSFSNKVQSEDWSDWADAKADLSLRWAHMPFCWFCPKAAYIFFLNLVALLQKIVENTIFPFSRPNLIEK